MHHFDSLLAELAIARLRYEDLRRHDASFVELLDAHSDLDELRVLMGHARRHHTTLS
jgi:hypothetical protein